MDHRVVVLAVRVPAALAAKPAFEAATGSALGALMPVAQKRGNRGYPAGVLSVWSDFDRGGKPWNELKAAAKKIQWTKLERELMRWKPGKKWTRAQVVTVHRRLRVRSAELLRKSEDGRKRQQLKVDDPTAYAAMRKRGRESTTRFYAKLKLDKPAYAARLQRARESKARWLAKLKLDKPAYLLYLKKRGYRVLRVAPERQKELVRRAVDATMALYDLLGNNIKVDLSHRWVAHFFAYLLNSGDEAGVDSTSASRASTESELPAARAHALASSSVMHVEEHIGAVQRSASPAMLLAPQPAASLEAPTPAPRRSRRRIARTADVVVAVGALCAVAGNDGAESVDDASRRVAGLSFVASESPPEKESRYRPCVTKLLETQRDKGRSVALFEYCDQEEFDASDKSFAFALYAIGLRDNGWVKAYLAAVRLLLCRCSVLARPSSSRTHSLTLSHASRLSDRSARARVDRDHGRPRTCAGHSGTELRVHRKHSNVEARFSGLGVAVARRDVRRRPVPGGPPNAKYVLRSDLRDTLQPHVWPRRASAGPCSHR